MDTAQRVTAILAEQALLDPSDLRPDTRLADLGIDSLALVESIFAIEEAFDISVPFNAADPGQGDFDATSVGSVVAAVMRLVAERG